MNAIKCAESLQKNFLNQKETNGKHNPWDLELRISLNYGSAMSERGGFFEESLKKSKRMCTLAKAGQVTMCVELYGMHGTEIKSMVREGRLMRVLDNREENFLKKLFDETEANLTEESFNVTRLCKLIGISRPQLYRRTTSLTGKSPNSFIKDFRMEKAWQLIRGKKGNIAEVALMVGYSNPSYFSKLFNKTFGYTLSAFSSVQH